MLHYLLPTLAATLGAYSLPIRIHLEGQLACKFICLPLLEAQGITRELVSMQSAKLSCMLMGI